MTKSIKKMIEIKLTDFGKEITWLSKRGVKESVFFEKFCDDQQNRLNKNILDIKSAKSAIKEVAKVKNFYFKDFKTSQTNFSKIFLMIENKTVNNFEVLQEKVILKSFDENGEEIEKVLSKQSVICTISTAVSNSLYKKAIEANINCELRHLNDLCLIAFEDSCDDFLNKTNCNQREIDDKTLDNIFRFEICEVVANHRIVEKKSTFEIKKNKIEQNFRSIENSLESELFKLRFNKFDESCFIAVSVIMFLGFAFSLIYQIYLVFTKSI